MNYCTNCRHKERGFIRTARCSSEQQYDPVTQHPVIPIKLFVTCKDKRAQVGALCPDYQDNPVYYGY